MKAKQVSKENGVVKFEIEFSQDEFAEALNKAYLANREKFSIDGFRKGKAPRKIIESHYGHDIFWDEALNGLLERGYFDAIKEMGIDVISQPSIDSPDVKKDEPVVITGSVQVFPEIDVKKYKGLEVEKMETKIGAKEVNAELERVQKSQARMETVENRKSKKGDTLVFDFEGSVDGEVFEGGTAENYELKLGSGQFIPGFEDQLIGAKAGEEVDVKVTFPEEYHAENLAGKDAVFHCKVNEIREEQLPELDDEFAKDVSDFDTLEEMKNDIKAKLLETSEVRSLNEAKDNLVEQIYENNKFDPPQSMVQDELSRALSERDQQLRYQGITLQQFLQFTGVKLEDMMNEMKPEIEQRVASRILLRSIAEQEKLEVTDEDLDKELTRMAELYSSPEKKYDAEEMKNLLGAELESFKKDIIITKTIDYLYDNAKVKMVKAEEKKDKKEKED